MSKILITGCPRNGTRYMSNIFNRVGKKIGHEYVSEDGCSSGFYVGDFEDYPVSHKIPVSQIKWNYIIHVYRHPCRAVPSLARLLQDVAAVRRWYAEFGLITDDLTESAMCVWNWSHRQVMKNLNPDITVNLDWLPEYWPEISKSVGVTSEFPYRVRVDNSYPYIKELNWDDLESCNYEKSIQIKDLWFKLLSR